VQTGLLSMASYLQQLRDAIPQEVRCGEISLREAIPQEVARLALALTPNPDR